MKKTVYITGRGAVGMTMGSILDANPDVDFAFVCDPGRKEKYLARPVKINGETCEFCLLSPEDQAPRADVMLFACKSYSLGQAMEEAAPFIDDSTILMSLINGISSEGILRRRFPNNPVLPSIAQKMDSRYDSAAQTLDFTSRGEIVFGADFEELEGQADEVEALFVQSNLPYKRSKEIILDQCRKLMANCGLNQICALYGATYGDIANDPKLARMFRDVMGEVRSILSKENMDPGQEALEDWVKSVAALAPESMPSMAQDMLAGRPIELELFSGTMLEMAKKHSMEAPLLQMLYDGLKEKTAGIEEADA